MNQIDCWNNVTPSYHAWSYTDLISPLSLNYQWLLKYYTICIPGEQTFMFLRRSEGKHVQKTALISYEMYSYVQTITGMCGVD